MTSRPGNHTRKRGDSSAAAGAHAVAVGLGGELGDVGGEGGLHDGEALHGEVQRLEALRLGALRHERAREARQPRARALGLAAVCSRALRLEARNLLLLERNLRRGAPTFGGVVLECCANQAS